MTIRPTVFIVEDHALILKLTAQLLEGAGLITKTFASAEDFFENYEPVENSCLLLDVRLPGMTGFELQQKLSASDIDLPVILVSGCPDSVREEGLANGAVAVLAKPINLSEVIRQVWQSVKQRVSVLAR